MVAQQHALVGKTYVQMGFESAIIALIRLDMRAHDLTTSQL